MLLMPGKPSHRVAAPHQSTRDRRSNRPGACNHAGGASWRQGGDLSGYRSGVDWVWVVRETVVAVGPTGSDVSYDGARRWTAFDTTDFDAADCVPGTCWASGPDGAVAVLAGR